MLALLATLSVAEASDLGPYEPVPTGYGWIGGAYDVFPTQRSWQVSAATTAALLVPASVGLVAWRFQDPNLPLGPWLTLPVLALGAPSLGSWLVNGQHFGAEVGGTATFLYPATAAGAAAGALTWAVLSSDPDLQPVHHMTGAAVAASLGFSAVVAWGPTIMAKSRWSVRRHR